jgi:hypothetical protein
MCRLTFAIYVFLRRYSTLLKKTINYYRFFLIMPSDSGKIILDETFSRYCH